jgi:uncharacterized protein YbaP (TraB family)
MTRTAGFGGTDGLTTAMTGTRPAADLPRPLRRAVLVAAAAAVCAPVGRAWAGASSRKRYDKGLLWRVERDGAPGSCIFGTIHLADARVAQPGSVVLDTLSRSRTFVSEIASGAMATPDVFESEQLADDQRLESLIGPDAYAQLRLVLVARGVPERVIARMKPWVAMLAVASSGSRDASLALDERLLAAARRARLRVLALEMVDEQIAAFDTVPRASQVALLRHALAHPAALAAENESTIRAWLDGDLAALVRFPARMDSLNPGIARHYDALVRHIVHDRTILMHHRLTMPLRTGRAFVAVGAMHLQGEKGLLALLEQDGFRMTRIG